VTNAAKRGRTGVSKDGATEPSKFAAELLARREHVAALTKRLREAYAGRYQELLKVRELFAPRWLAHMAYYRDEIISGLLQIHFAKAVAEENPGAIARIKQLWEKWHTTDKGPGWRSEAYVRALRLLRKMEVIRIVCGDDVEWRTDLESDFLAPLGEPLANAGSDEFEKALARAKAFRAQRYRQESGITYEFNPRTALTALGIECQLQGKTNVGYAKDLKDKYEPRYAGAISNFRKKLDQCLVPWTRRKRGRPAVSKKKGTAAIQK
jgi:hypothetical protein